MLCFIIIIVLSLATPSIPLCTKQGELIFSFYNLVIKANNEQQIITVGLDHLVIHWAGTILSYYTPDWRTWPKKHFIFHLFNLYYLSCLKTFNFVPG